jgi:hypothetical protein
MTDHNTLSLTDLDPALFQTYAAVLALENFITELPHENGVMEPLDERQSVILSHLVYQAANLARDLYREFHDALDGKPVTGRDSHHAG